MTTTQTFRNLITGSMNTKQITKIACAILVIFSMIACKKETPVTVDSVKPKMQLQITGYGVNKTFYSDSIDYYSTGTLFLKTDEIYTYTVSISDAGGVRSLQMTADTNAFAIRYPELTGTPAFTYTILPPVTFIQEIIGDRGNPYISFLMSGKFIAQNKTHNNTDTYVIQCLGSDYTPNLVGLNIPCVTTNQPPHGYGWKEL